MGKDTMCDRGMTSAMREMESVNLKDRFVFPREEDGLKWCIGMEVEPHDSSLKYGLSWPIYKFELMSKIAELLSQINTENLTTLTFTRFPAGQNDKWDSYWTIQSEPRIPVPTHVEEALSQDIPELLHLLIRSPMTTFHQTFVKHDEVWEFYSSSGGGISKQTPPAS